MELTNKANGANSKLLELKSGANGANNKVNGVKSGAKIDVDEVGVELRVLEVELM